MRYILTGAPGSGKTTLLKHLSDLGYVVVQEAATDVISASHAKGVTQPWLHVDFIKSIFELQKKRQIEIGDTKSHQFYDRSPVCTYALALYLGFPPSRELLEEIDRVKRESIYSNSVFFLENLGFIENTDARQISFDEALKFERLHLEAYKKFGYECIMVRSSPVSERLELIKNILK